MIDFLESLAQWVGTLLAVIAIVGGGILAAKWFVGLIFFFGKKGHEN